MGKADPYPYDRWPKLTRAAARQASEHARRTRSSFALDAGPALGDARALLGAAVSVQPLETTTRSADAIAAELGASVALIVSLGGHRAVIALAPGIARVIGDRVVGGTGADVALGPTPLSRGEAGLVGYVVARLLSRVRAPVASLVDVGLARDVVAAWGTEPCAVTALEVRIGEAAGTGALVVPDRALASLAPSVHLDPALVVRASIVIGTARLPVHEVRALRMGDVIVPDELTIDPRIADVGGARLVVGRSARTFELELAANAWRVIGQRRLSAPRAPSRWKQRKDPTMSQPDTDTLRSLADVEVELSIELARLEMPVAEVASLAPGVVVTTGRLVGERVAVRAGDRVIAWGELVDVEGEVGVRVTQVASGGD